MLTLEFAGVEAVCFIVCLSSPQSVLEYKVSSEYSPMAGILGCPARALVSLAGACWGIIKEKPGSKDKTRTMAGLASSFSAKLLINRASCRR